MLGHAQAPRILASNKLMPLVVLISLVLFVTSGSADEPYVNIEDSRFPIDGSGIPFLPVRVFDKDVQFMVDTGANLSALDSEFKPLLGPAIARGNLKTYSGLSKFEFFPTPVMHIGIGAKWAFRPSEMIACINFSAMAQAAELECLCVVGTDFLREKIVRFNFDEAYFQFPREPSIHCSHNERMRMVHGLPQVLACLPGEGFRSFLIDSGSVGQSIGLDRECFDRLMARRKIAEVRTFASGTVDREVTLREGVLECFEFGPHRFFNLVVAEVPKNMLQLNFLRRFDVELDFPNENARFCPGRRIDVLDRRVRTALGMRNENGKTYAEISEYFGSDSAAGIQSGDQILSLNGVNIEHIPLLKCQELRTEPGSELRVKFERAGIQHEVTLKLSDDPDPFPAASPHEIIADDIDFEESLKNSK